MKTFNLSSSVIQHENHSSAGGFAFPSVYPLFNYSRDAQRQGSFRGSGGKQASRHAGKLEKEGALEWELTEGRVSSWVHNTPFLLRGLLVVINETSSSGSAILRRFSSGSGVPLVPLHSHFHFRLSKTMAEAPRHLLWQAIHRSPLPLATHSRFSQCVLWTFRALCRAYFFRLAPWIKWATPTSFLWSHASILIWL